MIAFLMTACGTTSTPRTSASPSPAITALAGHIIFTRAGGGYGDETVFVAKADGTDEHRISELGTGCCPWATRDGSRLVVSANAPDGRVSTVAEDLDGSNRVVLPLPKGTLNLGSGPFSPDGTLVALEGFDPSHRAPEGIYLERASDGTGRKRVTTKEFIPGDFSPDGNQLLLFQSVNPKVEPPAHGSLWLVNVDGSGLHQITAAGTMAQCCFNYRWSPDGRKILFADEYGTLWTIAPDGSSLTQLFKDPAGRYAITPTWSPDGSMIMFALDPAPNPFSHPNNGMYVILANGSSLTQVIGGDDFKREPVWVSG